MHGRFDVAALRADSGNEERHIAEAIAVNIREMFNFRVPIVAVVIGEGGSGGALGIARDFGGLGNKR